MTSPNGSIALDESIDNEDYYAFLNVSKKATAEEIRNAYKALSLRFHPDRHKDSTLKVEAEQMFGRLKKAYDVLSDPQKRAIYDTLGVDGINADNWALVERKFKSAEEIKEEYEKLVKEREERLMQQRTNPKGSVTVLIDATDIFEPTDEDEEDEDEEEEWGLRIPNLEVRSMSIAQSIEAPITSTDNVALSGNINVRNGVGSGVVSVLGRHVFSPTMWAELELGAGNGPMVGCKLHRSITSSFQASLQPVFHVTPYGVSLSFVTTLTRQFNRNLIGYLTWKTGHDSSMATVGVYENEWCRVVGSVTLGARHSYVSGSYTHKFETRNTRVKVGARYGLVGTFVEWGGETKVSNHSNFGATLSVGTHTGVTLRLKFVRNQQTYLFPLMLSEQILPASVFYGTLAPALGYYCFKRFLLEPFMKQKEIDEVEQRKKENESILKERRREAMAYRVLMDETFKKVRQREVDKGGLVVDKALYGRLDACIEHESLEKEPSPSDDVFNVTLPLQVMVDEDSTLRLPDDVSKNSLPGFFDAYCGGPKKLLVIYSFGRRKYRALLDERQGAKLPSQEHLLPLATTTTNAS